MSLQVEKLENNTAKLTIEVPAEEFDKAIQAAYQKNKNKFNVPGFRKGKVPYAMVEKMYGAGVFYEEAANELIPDAYANAEPDNSGSSIGGGDIRVDSNRKVVVNIDGGTNGKVKIGDYVQIFGKYGAISGTEVKIGNNVLLKMKPWESPNDKYINVKGAEAAVGTRNNPAAGGLVNTIGDNTELWYYSKGLLQKIVHGKNVCTKNEILSLIHI